MKQDKDELRKQFNEENVHFNESEVRIVPDSLPVDFKGQLCPVPCPGCGIEILLPHFERTTCWKCHIRFLLCGTIAFYGPANTDMDIFRYATKKWFEQAGNAQKENNRSIS